MKHRITTGLFGPVNKRLKFTTTMFCLDCETMWDASNLSLPCPKCASKATIPAARWAPVKYGMPKLESKIELGTVGVPKGGPDDN